MSKALSRNSRRSEYESRGSSRESRRSGRSLGDWLNDEVDRDDRADEFESDDDRMEDATRRLSRSSESRRHARRWRDEPHDDLERSGRNARRWREDDEPPRFSDRIDAKAIVDEAAAIVEKRLEESDRYTKQAFENIADLIARSQRQSTTDASDAARRAFEAFAERADKTERQTARALNDIAGLLEAGQRDRVEAENGIVTLAERLARIEGRLNEQSGQGATARPIRNALARLESRLDNLARADRTSDFEHALSGLDQRLAEIARRLEEEARQREEREEKARAQRNREERETFERARAEAAVSPANAARRMGAVSADALEQGLRQPSPARRPLVDAISEITRRQRTLDEAFAASQPEPLSENADAQQRFDSLQQTIDSIARQLSGVREDATERADQQLVAMRQIESLRREVQDMAHAVGDLAPRASVNAVENALRDLADRIDAQRDRGVADNLLVPAERIA
ncbi:MAG: hypothetical protein N2444_01610, partial [Methylocystis sp.]|nr:hypothetical protein [Methylocystis sp.]